jgi:hypothetical protein
MARRKPESELRYHRKSPLPNPLEPGSIEESLTRLLLTDTIRQIARETDFVVRERKIDPVAFLWTFLLDSGVQLHRFLEELRAAYVQSSELEEIDYASYYLRFSSKLSAFLRRCLEGAIANLPGSPGGSWTRGSVRSSRMWSSRTLAWSASTRAWPRSSPPLARAKPPPGSRSTHW